MVRVKAQEHLRFIRLLPCLVCGDNTATEAAHVRHGDRSIHKPLTGIGIKPDDAFVVPLCSRHHHEQHKSGEVHWWARLQIDAVKAALGLWFHTGDHEAGERIVQHHNLIARAHLL